jgi:large exoprotein involved in heme utilization and adhesion
VTVSVTGSATFTNSMIQTSPAVFSFAGNAGAVSITANDNLSMTNTTIDASSFFAAGDAGPVTLHTNGTLFLTDSHILTNASAPGNGGAVTITGKDVTFTRTSISTDVDTGFFDASVDPALGQVRPGAVTITAQDTVTLSGTGVPTPIISATAVGTLLDAGSVTITGKTVNLSNGTINTTLSDGNIVSPANGGTIKIYGNDVSLTQFWLLSNGEKSPQSSGTGGSILLRGSDNLRADNIQLANSRLSSAAGGGGGGGPIEFQTKALTISDHTDVGTSSFGTGAGGTVTVKGAENVTIQSGSRVLTDVVNGLASESPVGSAGNVLIETQNLTLRSGGQIGARALPLSTGNAGNITVRGNSNNPAQSILIDGTGSGIFSTAEGTGAGGNILLNAASVTLQNGGALSAVTSGSASSATGGTIKVDATNTVTMNSASITSSSMGVADAGSIDLTAMNGFSIQNSTITTLAGQGASGGNIKVTTSPAATVWLQNSKISASVADGHGGGGNISIDPQFVILQNSQILAQAAQGRGGAITITTNLLLQDANSIVNADSGSGVNGTVTIQSPNAPISGHIQPLGKTPLIATSLLNQRCASLAGGEFSSFTVAGRDSLPTEPGSWLASPLALGLAGTSGGTVTEGAAQARVIDPAQETTLLSLRQIAPAGFLTQAFAVDWSASCQS